MAGSLCGCGNGSASPAPAVPIDVASASKLQLGVGTATINTDTGSVIGTNYTMTFRGPDGNNATGVNTPTLTGPPSYEIGFPGSANAVSGMPPLAFANYVASLQAGTSGPYATQYQESLGPYAGVFGYGMANDNLVSSQLTLSFAELQANAGLGCTDLVGSGPNVESTNPVGTVAIGTPPPNNVPYVASGSATSSEIGLPLGTGDRFYNSAKCAVAASNIPLFSPPAGTNGGNPNDIIFPINYYGGPPAWPSPQGYGAPAFFVGFGLGFTDSPATPVVGTYTLDVAYPTSADYSTSAHVRATAQLRSVAALPLMPKPSLRVGADGTGVVSVNVPPGLFETVVVVRSNDCRSSTNAKNNYAQVSHGSGPQTFVFSANLGPPDSGGTPSRTFCASGSGAVISAIGFDYPAYESSYPFDMSMAPKITNGDGHSGQADVTTSPPLIVGSQSTASASRRAIRSYHRRALQIRRI